MSKLLGIIAILVALALAYFGYDMYQEATNSLSVGSLELSADDQESKTTSFLLFGGSGILLLLGIYTLTKK